MSEKIRANSTSLTPLMQSQYDFSKMGNYQDINQSNKPRGNTNSHSAFLIQNKF